MRQEDIPHQDYDTGIASLIVHWEARRRSTQIAAIHASQQANASDEISLGLVETAKVQVIYPGDTPSEEAVDGPAIPLDGELLVQALVTFGDKTNEGQIVRAVTIAWDEIIKEILRDPDFIHRVPWRKLEELIAGAYEREGWPDVVLTPRSRDKGRDVIATKPGYGSIRIFDQIKAYKKGHEVTADEVRSLLGVLAIQGNVSKGIVTTTSHFAPGIYEEAKKFMPYRLDLKDGKQLVEWFRSLP